MAVKKLFKKFIKELFVVYNKTSRDRERNIKKIVTNA